jgi:beta-galactosidase
MVIKPGEYSQCAQDLYLSKPQLWSPETPHLYRLETELCTGDTITDTTETNFGIRSIQVDAEKGFLLNGQPLKMKGGCVHHDNGVMGSAAYDRSEERKVEIHKASGYNAIRTAHNPPSPAFLDACDRLGMLVLDEAFDCWREGKNPYDYHVVYDDWWQRDIDSMVQRDRNHPSVVVWSIGNEVIERDGRSNGAETARRLAERVRFNDPSRPITSAICGNWDGKAWPVTDGVFAALDIGGYNYMYREYRSDHERHPQRVMFGTETFPKEAFENWNSVLELSYVIGDFVWTSLDYLGETGIGRVHFDADKAGFLGDYPWHQANCGDLDLCGFKRPQSYYRDILWQNGSPLYIAVHTPIPEGKTPFVTQWGWPDVGANWTWPGQEGQTFTVDVYSGCDQVELRLNGQSLGVKPSGADEKRTATFEVPYAPGELKAIGYTASQPVSECILQTTGAPAGIRLAPDRAAIKADGADLCFITVEVVDAAGRMYPHADQAISFTVEGEGSLAAVGSGNPTSTESYRGSQRQAFRGRCLAVVKSNGKPGEIRLHAQAVGLQSTTVIIHAG